MHITIKGFRSIQQFECEFQQDSITLISGSSGSGKSTLMNAILWCLYGSLRNVRKFGTKSGTCMVKLTLGNDFSLVRSKSPELLQFAYKGTILQDKEAQDKIVELYGQQEKWITCCYLRQGTRNLFLESSPSERLQLLSTICFQNQNPEQFVEKISSQIQLTKNQFDAEQQILKRDLEIYQSKVENFKTKYSIQNIKSCVLPEDEQCRLERSISDDSKMEDLDTRYQFAWKEQKQKEIFASLLQDRIQKFPEHEVFLSLFSEKQRLLDLLSCSTIDADLTSERQRIEFLIRKRDTLLGKISDEKLIHPDYETFLSLSCELYSKLELEINDKIRRVPGLQKRRVLEDQKQQLESKIGNVLPAHELDFQLKQIEIEIEKTKKIKQSKYDFEILKQEIGNHWDEIHERHVTENEFHQCLVNEKNQSQRQSSLENLQLACDSTDDVIQKAIRKRRFLIDLQTYFPRYSGLVRMSSDIQLLQDQIDSLGKRKDWIEEKDIPNRMIEHQTSQNLLTCPNCQCKLRYDNHSLVKSLITKTVQDLGKLIEESKKRIEWRKQMKLMQDEFDFKMDGLNSDLQKINLDTDQLLQFPCLEKEEQDKLYHEIHVLETLPPKMSGCCYQDLSFMEKKWKAKQLETIFLGSEQDLTHLLSTKLNLESEKTKLEIYKKEHIHLCEEISKLPSGTETYEMNDLMNQLNECKDIQSKIVHANQIQNLENEVHSLQDLDLQLLDLDLKMESVQKAKDAKEKLEKIEKIEEILDLTNKINVCHEDPVYLKSCMDRIHQEREDNKKKLEMHSSASDLVQEKQRLVTQREQVVVLNNKIVSLSKIKMLANELEHKRMMATLQTIGDVANDILTMLFDEPIKIDFDVFKTSKNQKTTKPSINYKILYKGHEIDSIDQLSGGEADRVSLAVNCALFRFSSFPFLMLDEFASALDVNNKETAIASLKAFIGDSQKSILCISHDTVEGIYDHHFKF